MQSSILLIHFQAIEAKITIILATSFLSEHQKADLDF